ncbi:MAG TPA: hypothetical protein VND65_18160 [Candidatus Binatia bacterium]|nr:hypothetical protein [Candidatus Binatia bacterium]
MPMIYSLSPATAGNTTTNGTPGTENDTFFVKAGARNAALQAMYAIGKGAGLTAISGIVHRLIKWATASTGGTGITPTPKDPGMQVAKQTAASAPTPGSTRTNQVVFGHGAAGPGGWVAQNPDSLILLEGSSAGSIDAMNASGTASLNFEWSAETVE